MKRLGKHAVAVTAAATASVFGLATWQSVQAAETDGATQSDAPASLPTVVVQGKAQGGAADKPATRTSESSLGLDMTVRETPQSISVITRETMDDFHLTNVNSALAGVAGVRVEQVETDRTYYTARGFDITNFQVDGVGLPMAYGLVEGDLDTAIYERVDVVHGAAGLLTGTGNPSATINFIRKRPTGGFQANVGVSAGSWNTMRVDGDVSGPLNEAGTLRGRLVAAGEKGDSYLDRYHKRKGVVDAVLEADLDTNTLLTAGFTRQNNRPTGVFWGGLPLTYSDGSATHYDRSTSTSPDWTYWSTDTTTEFVELRHAWESGWQAKLTYTHKDLKERSRLMYVSGTPERGTGDGLTVYESKYTMSGAQNLLNAQISGPFTLGGREHEVVLGVSSARSGLREKSMDGDPTYTALGSDLTTWNGEYEV